ncbi:DMT family transporter [Wenyingzhuangia marina]|uniref:Permease of the drug/metabolite transporter (DMT) superfamily n=1 Tax=Wenyingzhuangia marina TaxID=1195760 RepID=A0A1M5TB23_9FLAO|nr:DMT family transporter [Wenyingzhuangia marina]GGF66149.1 multidrug transporter [Wenyingzhuangia marina]SHH47987.1 Permease of the drug/metabolite transporter (DMT) superfamily [Wenyingzhuangia marina]
MSKRNLALLAVFSTAVFYGINYTLVKRVMPNYLSPYALVWVRICGATILFWITSFMIKSSELEKKDFPKVALLSIVAIVINILSFFKGLSLTTPINASVIMVTTPILVFVFSLIILKEKLELKRGLGIIIGLLGAFLLTTADKKVAENAVNIPLGNLLVFVNASGYALYLILTKQMIEKYHPITFIKWLYTFGLLFMTPFIFNEVLVVEWQKIPFNIYLIIAYVVVFATYCNFLFNLYGLKQLKPTTVSAFIYTQPVIASLFALLVGSDELSWVKIASTLLIFIGVYLVTLKPNEVKNKVTAN